jgi:Fic family protein
VAHRQTDFLPNFSHGLLAFDKERLDEVILEGSEVIKQYVDIMTLQEKYRRLISRKSRVRGQEVLAIWSIVSGSVATEFFHKGGDIWKTKHA